MSQRKGSKAWIDSEAQSYCIKNNIRIYPIPISAGTYRNPAKVKIEIKLDGKTPATSGELYDQDKVDIKIKEYYLYYYNKR